MRKKIIVPCILIMLLLFLSYCKKKEEGVRKIGDNHFLTNLKPIKDPKYRPNVTLSYSHTIDGPFQTVSDFHSMGNYDIILERNQGKLTLIDQKNNRQKKEFILDEMEKPNRIILMEPGRLIIEDTYNSKFYQYVLDLDKFDLSFIESYTRKGLYHLSYYNKELLGVMEKDHGSGIWRLNEKLEPTETLFQSKASLIIFACCPGGLVIADAIKYHTWHIDWQGNLVTEISLSGEKLLKSGGPGFFKKFMYPGDIALDSPTALNRIYTDYTPENKLRIIIQTNLMNAKNVFYYYDIFIEGILVARIPYNFDILSWSYNSIYFLDNEKNIRCLNTLWKTD